MFHGGTNWGFMNGANIEDDSTDNGAMLHDTSSYDYDAPLAENGDYTDKYYSLVDIIKQYNEVETLLPDFPINSTCGLRFRGHHRFTHKQRCWTELRLHSLQEENLGIPANSILKIEGRVCDTVMVLINGELKSKILEEVSDLDGFGCGDGKIRVSIWAMRNMKMQL
ncbi:beta-galactosidase related [Holotrichia oblita]|uniref:Beta-galactosidase related n=1 Tax=Holotrichia oblita TaxID=644536 RepID=A0ACB9SW26_HOLOL|nr:beta-galactosidase related [Holotrichia oblita]